MNSRLIISAIFFLSGASALIYEVVWTRMLVLTFGATALAVSTVLTAFMAGLALGGYVAGRWSPSLSRLLLVYGLLEIGIGLYGLSVPHIFSFLEPVYQVIWEKFEPTFYVFSILRFLLAFLVLVIPATFMGATLPVLSQHFVGGAGHGAGREIGRLYGINTAGAVLGTFSCGYWLLPALGTAWTIKTAGAMNLLLGAVALFVAMRQSSREGKKALAGEAAVPPPHPTGHYSRLSPTGGDDKGEGVMVTAPPRSQSMDSPTAARVVLVGMAVSGFSALVYEVAWTRVLTLVLGSTVYSFTAMLTTFLLGLAVGALIAARFVERLHSPIFFFGTIQVLVGIFVFITMSLFGILPQLYVVMAGPFAAWHNILLAVKFLLAMLVMLLPTLLLGALFPVAIRVYHTLQGSVGRTVGNVYAANTLGAIGGAFMAGFVLIPLLGSQFAVLVGIVLNMGVAIAAISVASVGRTIKVAMVGAAALGGLMIVDLRPSWDPLIMTSGPAVYLREYAGALAGDQKFSDILGSRKEMYYREGLTTTVSVYETSKDGKKSRVLTVDGKTDASDAKPSMSTQSLLAHLPLLLAQDNPRVLVIGAGSGVTVGSALQYPAAKVHLVELEAGVVEGSKLFAHVNHRYWENPRVEIEYNDGRNALLNRRKERFDVIIVQPSDPWVRGASNLFTADFFRLVRDRLSDNGVYAQWLPGGIIASRHIRSLIATYRSVFDTVYMFQPPLSGDFVFLAGKRPLAISEDGMRAKMGDASVRESLRQVGILEPLDVFALLRMGARELDKIVKDEVINTDDNAWIEFASPTLFRVEPGGRIHAEVEKVVGSKILYDYLEMGGAPGSADEAVRRRLARSYRRMGLAMIQDGIQPNLAAGLFQRAISLEPAHVGAYMGLGRAYFLRGKPVEGFDALRKAMRLAPGDIKAAYEYAKTLDEMGAWTEAEIYYRRLVALSPQPRSAPEGEVQQALEQVSERLELFKKVRDSGYQISPYVKPQGTRETPG